MAHTLAFLACLLVLAPRFGARVLIESLQADGSPLNPDPETVPYNWSDTSVSGRLRGSPDIPLNDSRLAQAPDGGPGQVTLMYYGPSEVRVGWVTGNSSTGVSLSEFGPIEPVISIVQYGTEPGVYSKNATGANATTYNYVYDIPGSYQYRSHQMHSVVLEHLKPDTTYYYRVQGADNETWSEEFNFTTLPSIKNIYPLRIGLLGDGGQTDNSSDTYNHLLADKPQIIFHAGDFSYADDYLTNGSVAPFINNISIAVPPETYQPRWDSWQQLISPLFSNIPFISTAGNHEIEPQLNKQKFVSYSTRFPTPVNSSEGSQLWYSMDVGPVHTVFITSYAPYDESSAQYAWLEADLKKVDRKKTPWLVAVFHAPWYTSYLAHYMEANCHRLAVEPLLYEHNVDIVINGHVHAFERTYPVYNFTLDECGPVHLTVGDGGNIEKLAAVFTDLPGMCPPVPTHGPSYQPEACPQLLYDGKYCGTEQPWWSAFREPSFGHGILEVLNGTHALFQWKRNQDAVTEIADETLLVRTTERCEKKKEPKHHHYG